MPEYDREGGAQRIFHLVEFLSQAGWAVSFIAQNATGGERYARVLRQLGVATYAGSYSSLVGDEYLAHEDRLIAVGRFDLAILAFWYTAEHFLPLIRALSPQTRVIADSIDLHFLRGARGILRKTQENQPSGALDLDYAREMTRELNAYASADGVLTVSQKEADLVNDLVADPTLACAVPLMEELPPSAMPFAERRGILFLGNFRHPPNVEAARYLCSDILPRVDPAILAEHPVYIVGNALDDTVRGYGCCLDHVRMVGWVPSVYPYLERTRLSVLPLLNGAGTKTKLIQSLTVGTPSVSTRIGTEGLNLTDGEHVLIADDARTFADSIVRLIEDAELWQRLASQGRAHITAVHGREAVRKRFADVVSSVLAKDVKRATPRGTANLPTGRHGDSNA